MVKKLLLLVIVPAALLIFAKFAAMPILMHSWNAVVDIPRPSPRRCPRAGPGSR